MKSDPRLKIDKKILKKNYQLSMTVGGWFEVVTKAYRQIENTRKIIKTIEQYSKENKSKIMKELLKKGDKLDKKLKELALKIVPDREIQGINDTSHILSRKISSALRLVSDSFEPVSQAAEVKINKVKVDVKKIMDTLQNEIRNIKKRFESKKEEEEILFKL